MNFPLHALHILAAGIWLGGLVFTTAVVSPVFKRMSWSPAERIAVRSELGRQYSKVARANLLILLLAALLDWLARGWNLLAASELALIALIFLLSELHAQVFAPRLGAAARSGDETVRRQALRTSIRVSVLNLLLSIVLVVLSSAPMIAR